MRTDEFEYDLPPELIAQSPAPKRALSRLMVVDRGRATIAHDRFDHIDAYLRPEDVLVLNRTRVIPARLAARRAGGGAVELLLLRAERSGAWRVLARPSRKLRPGMELAVGQSPLIATVGDRVGEGEWLVTFSGVEDVEAALR